jgi:hypothetical protein
MSLAISCCHNPSSQVLSVIEVIILLGRYHVMRYLQELKPESLYPLSGLLLVSEDLSKGGCRTLHQDVQQISH